jgi:hypothetical protein
MHSAADPSARARALVDGLARVSLALSMFAATAVCLFFGLLFVTLGMHGILQISSPFADPRVREVVDWSLALCAMATAVSAVASIFVSRRRSPIRWAIPAGVLLGAATVIAGMRFDVGPIGVAMFVDQPPSIPLRAVLTMAGTMALWLVIGGALLQRREREDRDLER